MATRIANSRVVLLVDWVGGTYQVLNAYVVGETSASGLTKDGVVSPRLLTGLELASPVQTFLNNMLQEAKNAEGVI